MLTPLFQPSAAEAAIPTRTFEAWNRDLAHVGLDRFLDRSTRRSLKIWHVMSNSDGPEIGLDRGAQGL